MSGLELVFSYSHKDQSLRDELAAHLSPLEREGLISSWHDRRIAPGTDVDDEIGSRFERAKIIVLLVSSDFIASEYCYGREVSMALKRHETGDARVIPIILRPVDWTRTPFCRLLALPTDAKPVTSWTDRDAAFLDVAQGIRRAVQEVGSGTASTSPVELKIAEIFYLSRFNGVYVGGELQNPTSMTQQVTGSTLHIPALNAFLRPADAFGRYNGPEWWTMPIELLPRRVSFGSWLFSLGNDLTWKQGLREEPLQAKLTVQVFLSQPIKHSVAIYSLRRIQEKSRLLSDLSEQEVKLLTCASQGDETILVTGCEQVADRCFVQAGPCWLPYAEVTGTMPRADYEPWVAAVDSLLRRGFASLESRQGHSESYVLTPMGREVAAALSSR